MNSAKSEIILFFIKLHRLSTSCWHPE